MSINDATPQMWNMINKQSTYVDEPPEPPAWTLTPNKAKKYDSEKPAIDLVCADYILGTADVLTFGAKKYGKKNYLEGKGDPDYINRLYSAIQRHLLAFQKGELLDAESGKPHLFHASAGLAMLVDMEAHQ